MVIKYEKKYRISIVQYVQSLFCIFWFFNKKSVKKITKFLREEEKAGHYMGRNEEKSQ